MRPRPLSAGMFCPRAYPPFNLHVGEDNGGLRGGDSGLRGGLEMAVCAAGLEHGGRWPASGSGGVGGSKLEGGGGSAREWWSEEPREWGGWRRERDAASPATVTPRVGEEAGSRLAWAMALLVGN